MVQSERDYRGLEKAARRQAREHKVRHGMVVDGRSTRDVLARMPSPSAVRKGGAK